LSDVPGKTYFSRLVGRTGFKSDSLEKVYRLMMILDRMQTVPELSNNLALKGALRRTDDIGIVGRDLLLTPSIMIEEELKSALDEYYGSLERGTHPFFAAVLFHHQFESVHPFTDGNGRVGRELFNIMLESNGFPRVPFASGERQRYLRALTKGDDGSVKGMIEVFMRMMMEQRTDVSMENLKRLTSGD